MATPGKFVRVPLPLIHALLQYLDEKPHKEVRPFIDALNNLPVEVIEPPPANVRALRAVEPATVDPQAGKPEEGSAS